MQIKVNYLDNLRLEALFDDYQVISDQPVRYKGDGTAPGPFDYFLASSAMCAAYFVKVYCNSRNISTEGIRVYQNNIVDPENRYKQTFDLQIELPDHISEKDRVAILRSMDRCTVKRVIQNSPEFKISEIQNLTSNSSSSLVSESPDAITNLPGKDSSLQQSIVKMRDLLFELGISIEIASWRNPLPNVWSVHIRDADSPMCYTNGKGRSRDAALCSALGEYFERISCNYFYNDYFLGEAISKEKFIHYPNEKWFPISDSFENTELLDSYCLDLYNPSGELSPSQLMDFNSGVFDKGICAIPFIRQSDKKEIFFPVNLIGNLYVSNGMSAGNSKFEARVQCLSEIFERNIKNKIIKEELSLPDVPDDILKLYPSIVEAIQKLNEYGHPVFVKDASLGGNFPVICVVLFNPKTGGAFASFGAHPLFEVALERALTELLQGRSFEGLNDLPAPSFNSESVTEHNNLVDHFVDSSGVVSWKLFQDESKSEYEFVHWNFEGTTHEEFDYLMGILNRLEKQVYIADYDDFGMPACRILVPGFSEIYEVEDLIWDNHNAFMLHRTSILNIHQLSKNELALLLDDLEELDQDDYKPVGELIGICFEETTNWGQLVILELKALIALALKNFETASMYFEMLCSFSDALPKRKQFFQAMNCVLSVKLNEELDINHFKNSFNKMFGDELATVAVKSVFGDTKFYGLDNLKGSSLNIDKHQRLINSYYKLHQKRQQINS